VSGVDLYGHVIVALTACCTVDDPNAIATRRIEASTRLTTSVAAQGFVAPGTNVHNYTNILVISQTL